METGVKKIRIVSDSDTYLYEKLVAEIMKAHRQLFKRQVTGEQETPLMLGQ